MKLSDKKCIPCSDSRVPTLTIQEAKKLNHEIADWILEEKNNHLQISREFKFSTFKNSLKFVNQVGKIAEEQGHHPNIYIIFNKVKITLYTHIISGLHENDFILAAKLDELVKQETK